MRLLAQFQHQWGRPDYPPVHVDAAKLGEAENALGLALPMDYREELLSVGAPRPTAALLEATIRRATYIPNVAEFLEPHDIQATTLAWRELGLPTSLIAFASDSLGNLFVFCGLDPENSNVWLFDHETGSAIKISTGFEEWMTSYLRLPGHWDKF